MIISYLVLLTCYCYRSAQYMYTKLSIELVFLRLQKYTIKRYAMFTFLFDEKEELDLEIILTFDIREGGTFAYLFIFNFFYCEVRNSNS